LHYFVTGAAGFIGSNLCDRLLAAGHQVTGFDNLSTGREQFLEQSIGHPNFRLVRADLYEDRPALTRAMEGAEFVFHLAANADVRFGTNHPRRDLEQNTIVTWNVLEAMREHKIRRIGFSSTGSIYGEPNVHPTPEDCPFPVQTSLYGASKLASEGLLQAYATGFQFEPYIFRFVSILGERYSHGHVFDFYAKLLANPNELPILGDGNQRKSYLYVGDCIRAILAAIAQPARSAVYNLGADDTCNVTQSAGWICERLGLKPKFVYSGGERGWIGDSPLILLDCRKIRALGWEPSMTIRQAVEATVDYLVANQWLFKPR
jgi:UDP-glucose 4-epimerase